MIERMDLVDERFMPHGHCYFWEPFVLWSYAISDSIIATAYFSIPIALGYIYLKRKDFTYIWLIVLFAVFIGGCGITHVFDVVNIWKPLYKLDVIFRMITALASIGTAGVLIKFTPSILAIPSSTAWKALNDQLRQANEELQAQLEELREKDKTIQAYKEFERLTESLPQLIWTTNPYMTRNKSFYINQKWYVYTGLTTENNFDDIYSRCVPQQQQEALQEHWEHCLKTHETFERELLLRRFDGVYRWHLSKAVYSPETNHWVGTFTDIDDQKILAEQMAEKNKQLLTINTDLDNFIYTASHDLKAPIANIEGLTLAFIKRLTSKFLLDEEQNRMLSMLAASIDRLKSTIISLTEIAKAQKEDLEEEPVFLGKVIEEVYQDLEPLMTQTQLILHQELEVEEIKFARKHIRSILYNLLSNAIKYRSGNRNAEVRIQTKQSGQQVVITVEDNGMGMREENLQKLFTMFRRFHTHVEGTGIGLYIIKRIVENAGGKIEVESMIDVGTTFRVYLPIRS
jgi:signal transduction histidine kinase